jgi:hypothetical protein
VRVWRCFLLCVASHGRLESVGLISYTTAVNPTAFRRLMPAVQAGNPLPSRVKGTVAPAGAKPFRTAGSTSR